MTQLPNATELRFGWPNQSQTLLAPSEPLLAPRRLRLGRPMVAEESAFQEECLARIWSSLRLMALLMACVFAAYAVRDCSDSRSLPVAMPQNGAPALFFLWVFALTWFPSVRRFYSRLVVGGAIIAALLSLGAIAASAKLSHAQPEEMSAALLGGDLLSQQMRLLMVCFAGLRLHWKWAFALQASVLMGGTLAFSLAHSSALEDIARFLQVTWAVMVAATLAAWIEEQWARMAFQANQQLERMNRDLAGERDQERSKREHSEKTLRVLSQAVGGIAHDLGSPLATIQMGGGMLDVALEEKGADYASLRHLTEAIECGTQMLDCLRLSLIEQTRALEGKPTPLYLCPVSLLGSLQRGASFGSLRHPRPVVLPTQDIQICADEKKLVTVWMNLIDNALKYSDGDVQIGWQVVEADDYSSSQLLLTVMDKGIGGRGLSLAQSQRLFSPFERLESHANIEGTGLGLFSVRKIVEAHGGEIWIEGFEDGTTGSGRFSTSNGAQPITLPSSFRTSFVLTLPLSP